MNEFFLSTAVICMTAVLLLESFFPLHPTLPPLRRWLRNFALSAMSLGVSLLMPLLFWAGMQLTGMRPGDGLLGSWQLPVWAQWLITFTLLEGMRYALHRLSHRLPWLWRLHAVHHSDIQLDATSTHRHHPLENLITTAIALPVMLVLAPPLQALLAYTVLTLAIDTLSHGNLRIPTALDKCLRPFIATPAYHRVHHSATRAQTDSNYANVFPVFDYLFRSHGSVPDDGGREIIVGLETGRDAASQSLKGTLLAPFRRAP